MLQKTSYIENMETEDQQQLPSEIAIRDEFLCFAEESLHSAMEELHYKGNHQTMTGGMVIVYVTPPDRSGTG